jgi:transcriptional regulator with XRE-family HTH domain
MNFWKEQRERLGISQRRLAVLLGVSNNAVSTWERGDAIPELSRAGKLAEVLGIPRARVEREIVKLHRQIEPAAVA